VPRAGVRLGFRVVAQLGEAPAACVPMPGDLGSSPSHATGGIMPDTLPPDTDPQPEFIDDEPTWPNFSEETLAELVEEQAPEYRQAWGRFVDIHRAVLSASV